MTPKSGKVTDVIEVRENLSQREFEKEYLEKLRPVILDDSIRDWAARDWTPQWFKENFPDKVVQIDGKPVRLADFIDTLLSSDEDHPAPYLRNCDLPTQFPELIPYVSRAPHSLPTRLGSRLLPRNFPQENHYLDLFIGGPGSGFPIIHYDVHHLVAYLVQIYGRKEFTVYPPDQGKFLYPRASQPDESQIVDPLHPDYEKYPLWKEAKGITFVLEPGQTLFVPCGWWHFTRILTPSITIGYDQLCAANWGEFIGDQFARRRHRPFKARVFLAYLIATGTVLTALERSRGKTGTPVDMNFPRQFRKAVDFRL